MARVEMNPRLKREYALPQNSRNWTDAAAKTGKSAIAAAAPLRTGFLKSSLRTRTFPGRVGPTVRYIAVPEYAYWQEVGTGLYGPLGRWITPKRAKVLHWVNEAGRDVYARRTKGVPPKRYFKKGLEATFPVVRYYGAGGLGNYSREGG